MNIQENNRSSIHEKSIYIDLSKSPYQGKSNKQNGFFHFANMLFLLGMVLFTSCSTLVTVDVGKFYKSKIDINLFFEDFFAQYLFDLLGARTLAELFPKEDISRYLSNVDAISDIGVEYHEDLYLINITVYSNNVIATMQDLHIINDKKRISSTVMEFQIAFSRKIFLEMLSNSTKYSNELLFQSFFPDKLPFPNQDYAGYLAWALSGYGDEKTIENQLETSYTRIEMNKEDGFGLYPDKDWEKGVNKNSQYVDYLLMDMMDQKDFVLRFTF